MAWWFTKINCNEDEDVLIMPRTNRTVSCVPGRNVLPYCFPVTPSMSPEASKEFHSLPCLPSADGSALLLFRFRFRFRFRLLLLLLLLRSNRIFQSCFVLWFHSNIDCVLDGIGSGITVASAVVAFARCCEARRRGNFLVFVDLEQLTKLARCRTCGPPSSR